MYYFQQLTGLKERKFGVNIFSLCLNLQYRVHAYCTGMCVNTKAPLSKIKIFCPKYVVSE